MTETTAGPARAASAHLVMVRPRERLGWILIGVTAVLTAGLMMARGLAFDWPSAARPLAACVALLAGVVVYRNWRLDERIATSLATVALVVAFSAVAETLSYALASAGGPLWDDRLDAYDRMVGFDWRAYLVVVNGRPWLAAVYAIAYSSLTVQIIAAAVILGLSGRFTASARFANAVALAGLMTIVVSAIMPANSMFVHLGLRAADFPHIDSTAAYAPLAPFNALRAGTMRTISLSNAEGIIAFPSFHAALGVIFIHALWSVPWLRWPAAALNLLLIAATPLNGGHYLVDVIAGIAISVIAISAAKLDWTFGHRRQSRRALLRSPAG